MLQQLKHSIGSNPNSKRCVMRKLQFKSIDSKSEMIERLRGFSRTIVLGQDAQAPKEFLLTTEESLGVGVLVENHGEWCSGFVLPSVGKAFIGHDCTVDVIDLLSAKVTQSKSFLGTFFEFLDWQPLGLVLAFHELGLVAFNEDGSVKYQVHASDIVEDWKVTGDFASLSCSGSVEMKIDLSNGKTEIV
jgi:hypothetical protein